MRTKATDSYTAEGGAVGAFFDRQKENLVHWAAPKVELARAWGEYGAADGAYRGSIAADQGRRMAEQAQDTYVPAVTGRAQEAADAVQGQYKKYAPQLAAGVSALAPAVGGRLDSVQNWLEDLQKQAEKSGKKTKKKSRRAGRALARAAKQKNRAAKRQGNKAVKNISRTSAKARKNTTSNGAEAKAAALAGLAAVQSRLQDGSQKLSPQMQERLGNATRYAQQRRDVLLPVAAQRLSDAAGRAGKSVHEVKVPTSVEQTLINVTGDKKIVQKLRKQAAQYAGQTQKTMAKQAKQHSRSGGKGWIIAGMAVAAAGAAFAIWKLTKPVEDPWAAPAPGPVTANIPVVDGQGGPFQKQNEALAEAGVRNQAASARPVAQDGAVPNGPTATDGIREPQDARNDQEARNGADRDGVRGTEHGSQASGSGVQVDSQDQR